VTQRSPRTRLVDALATSVQALDPADQDMALVALLMDYARELDSAAALEARARKIADDVMDQEGPDSALHERVAALQAALSRRQALDRIGARFHAGLVEMLGTPRARAGGKAPGQPAPDAAGGALVKLRLASGDGE
jgi:hypothetical protein